MLKLNSSYSKKVPVPGQEFSSQQYHASVEVELSDGLKAEEIKERMRRVFQMVREAVETELNGEGKQQNTQQSDSPKPSEDSGGNGSNGKSNGRRKATNKQIKFITDLAGQKKIAVSDLNADIRKRFNVDGLYDLTSWQASQLLDSLKGDKAA